MTIFSCSASFKLNLAHTKNSLEFFLLQLKSLSHISKKNYVFVSKICKYSLYERAEGFCCVGSQEDWDLAQIILLADTEQHLKFFLCFRHYQNCPHRSNIFVPQKMSFSYVKWITVEKWFKIWKVSYLPMDKKNIRKDMHSQMGQKTSP